MTSIFYAGFNLYNMIQILHVPDLLLIQAVLNKIPHRCLFTVVSKRDFLTCYHFNKRYAHEKSQNTKFTDG